MHDFSKQYNKYMTYIDLVNAVIIVLHFIKMFSLKIV